MYFPILIFKEYLSNKCVKFLANRVALLQRVNIIYDKVIKRTFKHYQVINNSSKKPNGLDAMLDLLPAQSNYSFMDNGSLAEVTFFESSIFFNYGRRPKK